MLDEDCEPVATNPVPVCFTAAELEAAAVGVTSVTGTFDPGVSGLVTLTTFVFIPPAPPMFITQRPSVSSLGSFECTDLAGVVHPLTQAEFDLQLAEFAIAFANLGL